VPRTSHQPQFAQDLKKRPFEVRFDTAFAQVIQACATIPRPQQPGTWITAEMIEAYCRLHKLGFAHSAEAWADGELVGGLYGVSLGAAFFGESMFAWRPDASKAAFVHLVQTLHAWHFHFVDCQTYSDHLARFGAVRWRRERFLQALAKALLEPTRRGQWRGPAGGSYSEALVNLSATESNSDLS
jgi:leucyl/phenylalanyl-tRNA--protein transferase